MQTVQIDQTTQPLQSHYKNDFDMALVLFARYKNRILQHYHLPTIIDEDEDVIWYQDEHGQGISFKNPISATKLLADVEQMNG